MKDENELEALSQAQRDAILDSAAEVHEVMTDAAAVLARTLIGQGTSVDAVREDLALLNQSLQTAQRNYLKRWDESLLDGIELVCSLFCFVLFCFFLFCFVLFCFVLFACLYHHFLNILFRQQKCRTAMVPLISAPWPSSNARLSALCRRSTTCRKSLTLAACRRSSTPWCVSSASTSSLRLCCSWRSLRFLFSLALRKTPTLLAGKIIIVVVVFGLFF